MKQTIEIVVQDGKIEVKVEIADGEFDVYEMRGDSERAMYVVGHELSKALIAQQEVEA